MTNSAHNAIHKKDDDALPITRYKGDGTATSVSQLPTVCVHTLMRLLLLLCAAAVL